jgi:hypothetical protein
MGAFLCGKSRLLWDVTVHTMDTTRKTPISDTGC